MSTQVKASHILVETEAEAKKILTEIENGKDFAQAASFSSGCSKIAGPSMKSFVWRFRTSWIAFMTRERIPIPLSRACHG